MADAHFLMNPDPDSAEVTWVGGVTPVQDGAGGAALMNPEPPQNWFVFPNIQTCTSMGP